jgi:hypothetical protein
MPQIEGLVVAGVAMRGAERLRSGPRFEGRAALPDGVGRIERVILGFGAFDQVELDEARYLLEETERTQKYGNRSFLIQKAANIKGE